MTSKKRTVPDNIICNFGWKNFLQIPRKYTKIIFVPDHCCFLKCFQRIISLIIVIFPFLLWKERIFSLESHAASFDWKHENPSFKRQFLSKPKFCRDHDHSCCSWLSSSELPFSSILINIFCTFILWFYKKIFQMMIKKISCLLAYFVENRWSAIHIIGC